MPKLSIIIVNYNSGKFLFNCLQSIQQNVTIDHEVIIVDNNSDDNSFNICKACYVNNNYKFIQTGENLGFAKANNIGVRSSNGSIIHFLNPDTILPQGISNDYMVALEQPDCVYINQLRNPDGSFVKISHIIPTIGNYLKSLIGKGYKWSIGASIIISRKIFDFIGGWNESYFMYFEDLDLFYKLSNNKICCKPLNSTIFHAGGGCSSNVWTNKERQKKVNKAEKLFYKTNGILWQYPIIKMFHKLYQLFK